MMSLWNIMPLIGPFKVTGSRSGGGQHWYYMNVLNQINNIIFKCDAGPCTDKTFTGKVKVCSHDNMSPIGSSKVKS